MNSTVDILKSIASQFAILADAIEAEQNNTNSDILELRSQVDRNRYILKSIASLIEESI